MKNYPNHYQELSRLIGDLQAEIPETMNSFNALHKSACGEGALSTKTKELISLGIAITSRCDGCIAFHTHDAIKSGASKQEIVEAIGVAVLMGGGPAVIYGCEALEALKQFEMEKEQEAAASNV